MNKKNENSSERKKHSFFSLFRSDEPEIKEPEKKSVEVKKTEKKASGTKKKLKMDLMQSFRVLDEHPPIISDQSISVGIAGSTKNVLPFFQAAVSLLQINDGKTSIILCTDHNDKFLSQLIKECPQSTEILDVISTDGSHDERFHLNTKLLDHSAAEVKLYDNDHMMAWSESADNLYLLYESEEKNLSLAEKIQKTYSVGVLTDAQHGKKINASKQNLFAIIDKPSTSAADREWKSDIERKGFIIHKAYSREGNPHASSSSMRQQYLETDRIYNRLSSIRAALSIRYKIASLHAGFSIDDLDAAIQYETLSSLPETNLMLALLEHRCLEIFQIMSGWVSLDYAIQNVNEYQGMTVEDALIHMYQKPENRQFRDDVLKVHPCLVESHTEDKVITNGHDLKKWKKKPKGMDDLDLMSRQMFLALSSIYDIEKEDRDFHYKQCMKHLKTRLDENGGTDLKNGLELLSAGHERIEEKNAEAEFLWDRGIEAVKPYLLKKDAEDLTYYFKPVLVLLRFRSYKEADHTVNRSLSQIISNFKVDTIYRPYLSSSSHNLYLNLIGSMIYEPSRLVLIHIDGKKPDIKALQDVLVHAGRDDIQVSSIELSGFKQKKKADHAVVDFTGLSLAQSAFLHDQAKNSISDLKWIAIDADNVMDVRTWKRMFSSGTVLNINDMITLAGGRMTSLTQYNPIMGLDDIGMRNLLDLSLCKTYGWPFLFRLIDKYNGNTKEKRLREVGIEVLDSPQHYKLYRDGMMKGLQEESLRSFMNDLVSHGLIEKKPAYALPDLHNKDGLSLSFTSRYPSVYKALHFFLCESSYRGRHVLQLSAKKKGYFIHDDQLDLHLDLNKSEAIKLCYGGNGDLKQNYRQACNELSFLLGTTDKTGYHPQKENITLPDHQTVLRQIHSIGGSSLFTTPPVFLSSDNKVSLTINYANDASKDLFSKEGNILEIFLYRLFVKYHVFDDVQISVELNWKNELINSDSVWNEIDVIGIKGVETYLISCKKTKDINKSYLEEIKVETERFGINGHPILAATSSNIAKTLQNRAKELGIRLIGGDLMQQNEDAVAAMFTRFIEEDQSERKTHPLF